MAARRKSWDELSPQYRARLERQGITRERHSEGVSLHSARGHTSKEREYTDARYRRAVRDFAERQALYYYRDKKEVLDQLKSMPRSDVERIIENQRQAENSYQFGGERTPGFWESRDTEYPEWLYYYHGVFS